MTTYREVFAVPAFRVLFVSRSLAIGGDTLRIVALSMLVFSLTGSTLLSAITFGIGFMPQVIGGMLLGSLADRIPPRPLIVAGYACACVVATTLAVVEMPIFVSLGLVAVVAAFTPIFGGASSRLVSEVLTGDLYVLGRSMFTVASGAAQIAGMALGGLAVAAVGPRRALLISAACGLIAALVVRFKLADFPRPQGKRETSAVRQSWVTNVALLRDRVVRRLLLIQWLPPAFVVGAEALVVAYSAQRGFPSGSAGIMLAAAPTGMLVGDLVVGRFVRPYVRERLVAPLITVLGIPLLALALNPPMLVCAALLLVSASGFAYTLGLQQAFLDAVPEASRGQAFGLLGMGLMTWQGLGPVLFGGIGNYSIRLALAIAGACAVAAGALWGLAYGGGYGHVERRTTDRAQPARDAGGVVA